MIQPSHRNSTVQEQQMDYAERIAAANASRLAQAQTGFDNMAPPEGDEGDEILEAVRLCEEYLGRVERAVRDGDFDAARDLLRSAISELENEASEAS